MKPLIPFILLTSLGMGIYHVGQKLQLPNANPMVLLMGVYGVAFALAAAAAPFFRTAGEAPWMSQVFSWPVLVVGIGVLLIELGFLLVYRTGGALQWASVGVSAFTAVLLVPVAVLFFREHVSPMRIGGIFLTLAGLALMTWKRS